MVRTRFAPSPTGELHIGNARTALFAYLYARKNGGRFILRLEDTDVGRSKPEYSDAIIEDLKWLHIDYDEGPYKQSERLQIYKEYLNKLVEMDLVYECFCSPTELEERRKIALKSGKPPVYDGRCAQLTEEKKNSLKSSGKGFTYRFKFSKFDIIEFEDVIRKKVVFNPKIMGDPILVRADGVPAYNFACTIDDMLMGITDVIRGEDLLDQTPRQIAILKAFNAPIPRYAHLPLIMGRGKKPLSKRDGSTSVLEFKQQGFLAEALVNYLYRLGFSPPTEKQILTIDEMIEYFELERVSPSPAVFDLSKLRFINREVIRLKDEGQLLNMFRMFLNGDSKEIDDRFVKVFKDEIFTLSELRDASSFIFDDGFNPNYTAEIMKKSKFYLDRILTLEILNVFVSSLCEDGFDEMNIRKFIEAKGLKPLSVFMLIRLALSAREKGPSLADIVRLLGAERVKKRIELISRCL
ncbi:MAG: glutamate--tRNA ligase [Deltaproteobacteria bacterium]|nr:glutamate--tRNA ligase [Deltaproteobacteria bacterium]